VAKKANAAFMKPLQPSDALAKVVGSKALPRTQVVKKLWEYIKKNDLQDKKNRRNTTPHAQQKIILRIKLFWLC
jgi:chromatin remodeling complex protein RSC6